MSNTPRSQRSPTKFEAEHNFFQLRDQVTELILNPKTLTRERRKLKKYKHLLDRGVLAYTDIENCYKSWMGTYAKYLSKYQRQHIQDLYKSLFERSPRWKKEQK